MQGGELAWAAGLFEGEGTFTLARVRRDGRPELTYARASVVSTDRDVVERFHAAMGVGSITVEKRRERGHKDLYKWGVQSRAGFKVAANKLRPWLCARRRARLAEVESATTRVRRKPPRKPHCKRGHALVGKNRKPNGKGRITCRLCAQQRERARTKGT